MLEKRLTYPVDWSPGMWRTGPHTGWRARRWSWPGPCGEIQHVTLESLTTVAVWLIILGRSGTQVVVWTPGGSSIKADHDIYFVQGSRSISTILNTLLMLTLLIKKAQTIWLLSLSSYTEVVLLFLFLPFIFIWIDYIILWLCVLFFILTCKAFILNQYSLCN